METQEKRFRDRIKDPRKIWKLSPMDVASYNKWYDYSLARDDMFLASDTRHAPWYIVPADSRTRRNAMIARIVRGALEDMNLSWPDPGNRLEDFDFD